MKKQELRSWLYNYLLFAREVWTGHGLCSFRDKGERSPGTYVGWVSWSIWLKLVEDTIHYSLHRSHRRSGWSELYGLLGHAWNGTPFRLGNNHGPGIEIYHARIATRQKSWIVGEQAAHQRPKLYIIMSTMYPWITYHHCGDCSVLYR